MWWSLYSTPAWMSDVPLLPALSAGVSDTHCQAHGKEELPGEEFGSRGDLGIHIHHLLRQNWNPDSEPDDGGPHVV